MKVMAEGKKGKREWGVGSGEWGVGNREWGWESKFLLSTPHSLLFTQKFPDAVLTVGRLPRDDVQIHAGADRLLEAHRIDLVEQALRQHQRRGAQLGDFGRVLFDLGAEIGVVKDAIDDPDFGGLFGREHFARRQHFKSAFLAQVAPRERHDNGRNEADLDFGVTKLR